MTFCCIFVPNFMVQAVVRSEPGLHDRALALVDGTAPVWGVVGMNEAAAKAGIQLGMTKSQAQQFCNIEIRHRSRGQEKAAHAALMDLGWSVSPRVEDTAPDTVVLDLAGLNSLFGSDEKIAAQLAERASGLGLITQIATTSKIDAAILAARGFTGVTVIPEGEEAKILGRLPVNVLFPLEEASFPSGFVSANPETLETLDRWGVRTCEALAALPVLQLSERLGQEGVRLHELARAQSERSLVLAEPEIRFEEEMELEDAVEELEPLSFLLGRLLDQLCSRMHARSLAACAVRVRFELDPGFEVENINRPSRTCGVDSGDSRHSAALRSGLHTTAAPRLEDNSEQKTEPKIYERVLSLPAATRDAKMLLKLLRLRLQSDAPEAPILKIFLAADTARPRVTQRDLFLPSSPDPEKLELTVARLANLVGDSHVGSPELMDTHRPGEFRMRRFVALRDGAETRRKQRKTGVTQNLEQDVNRPSGIRQFLSGGSRHSALLRAGRTGANDAQTPADEVQGGLKRSAEVNFGQKLALHKTGFRVFRPALAARIDLQEGCPACVRFQGLYGQVIAASGPWRSSGDWWRENGWQNDEWDLEIEFTSAPGSPKRGFYRVFYDAIRQAWFVRGAYD